MPTVEGAGVPLSFREHGAPAPAPAVVLVHDLAGGLEALEPLAAALATAGDGVRVIAYDRRGYGRSGAPQPYGGTTVEEQAQDLAALVTALEAVPAVVAGEGFGALVALDLAKRHRGLVAGVVAADPPLFMLVPEATEVLAGQHARLQEAVAEGGPAAGVQAWRELQGRAGESPGVAPGARYRAFFADYAGLASWPATRRDLRALDVPVVVLTGARSPRHVVTAADALSGLLPAARRAADGDVAAAALSLLRGAPRPGPT